jgi:hypothetical protein
MRSAIVAHVVGDGRRVARVVFGNPRLDLPDQVGSHVGRLGVDPAADTSEQRDGRGAHGESGDDLAERLPALVGLGRPQEDPDHDPDAEQPEARHGEAHDRATVERHPQRHRLALAAGRLAGASIGAGGRLHPEEAREDRADPAKEIRDRRRPADDDTQQDRHDDQERYEVGVLPLQEGHRSGLDHLLDLSHPVVPDRLPSDVEEDEPGNDEPGGTRHDGGSG